MPRLTWRFIGAANGTGEREEKFLIDISEKLSEHYGRLVRQSNNFTVRRAFVRVYNPDEPGEVYDDEVLAASGKLVYYEPTANRAKAWSNAFKAWLANRSALGIKSKGADFRVGLSDGYKSDVGILTDGVKFNAWINADDDPLMLTNSAEAQSIFGTWNRNLAEGYDAPTNPNGGFGHWAQKDADSLGDELDFVQNEVAYYREDEASLHAAAAPFMVNFSAWFDNSTSDPADFGSATNVQTVDGPLTAMCGVIGVFVDTVAVDDSTTENQDYGLEVVLDIVKWSPIMKSKSKKRKSKGRK